jgi:hypothetical protein
MRKLFIPVLFALVLLAASTPAQASRATTLRVVMADPGCHWFSVHGKKVKSTTVHGPVILANYDEAALKIVGPGGTKIDKQLGKTTLKIRGTYRITMVGQAPDDNHLRLVVK